MRHRSASWAAVTDDTRDVLAQITGHDSLLSDEWRAWLQEAMDSLHRSADDETGVLAVRAARAAAVIGAAESAQAARFEARLIVLPPTELDRLQSELEARQVWLEDAQRSSAAHLECAVADLMAEFRAQNALEPRGASATRYRYLLGEDLARALRDHGDRTEELLLDLGEAACSLVGVAMGGLLPLRASHIVPLVDLGDDCRPGQVEATIAAMVASYRAGMSVQLASVMRRVRAGIDRARQWQGLGHDAADERIALLRREAQELDDLALSLDWLPVARPRVHPDADLTSDPACRSSTPPSRRHGRAVGGR